MHEINEENSTAPRYSFTHGNQSYVSCTEEELRAHGCTEAQIKQAKNNYYNGIAYHYITRYYEIWRQLTIDRVGSNAEKTKMFTFIDKVRDWTESDNPTQEQLHAIQP
ncbi:hypothetical protein [Algicola sagamiensis]|uniref:hypothetical protein n=1 Tax=Algicola sagamiensis TaxID=163869 RepID=UPI00037803DA|nr:hypothetical protein [Algicola sagamiensis]